MTTYVRITKATNNFEWYKNRIGMLYPVVESTETHYQVDLPYSKVHIYKSDCEVVTLPCQQGPCIEYRKIIEEAQEVLRGYIHPESEMTEKETIDILLGILDNRKLVTVMRSAPLPEGQHHITTVQVLQLVQMLGKHPKLEEWFPAVFALAKTTYHVGQQFANKDFPGVSYEIVQFIDNRVGILCNDDSLWAGTDGRQLHRVNDPQAITQEEFEQIIGPNSVRDKSLTLLPESGGQSV